VSDVQEQNNLFLCSLKALQHANHKRCTSGAKALIDAAYCGTAEAVPFVDSLLRPVKVALLTPD
jgi:hypothetical protein